MNWGHNGSTNGKAWIHPLSLHLPQKLTLPLPLLLPLSGACLCVCASAHVLSFFCHAWPIHGSSVQRVLFIPTFLQKISLELMSPFNWQAGIIWKSANYFRKDFYQFLKILIVIVRKKRGWGVWTIFFWWGGMLVKGKSLFCFVLFCFLFFWKDLIYCWTLWICQ